MIRCHHAGPCGQQALQHKTATGTPGHRPFLSVLSGLSLIALVSSSGCGMARTGLGPERPVVVAHRGFSHVAPENTLGAYQRAIDVGATLAECDVHLSADGQVVLMHDKSLERTTGLARNVGALNLAELKALDAGRWFGDGSHRERIPTLKETLELIQGRLRLIIELKGKHTAEPVVTLLRQEAIAERDVIVFSFQREEVARTLALNPMLYSVYLISRAPKEAVRRAEALDFAVESGCAGVGLKHSRVDAEFMTMAKARGLDVFAYTMNSEETIRAMIALGVDGLITDRPDLAQQIVSSMGTKH